MGGFLFARRMTIRHRAGVSSGECSTMPTYRLISIASLWSSVTRLKTLRRAKVPYFRIYDLRSTYATRLSAGGRSG